jgi:probable HAF family extracellular repeat protein
MKSRTLTWFTTITLFAALAVPARLSAQEQHYTVTDLSTLGGTFSIAFGMNNKPQVVGQSTLPGDTQAHAFLWQKGVMTDLGTLGGPNSIAAFPLNERGEVSGGAETSTPDPNGEDFCGFGTHLICLPFLWQHGVMTALPTLGGNNGVAGEISNRGQVVGDAENVARDPTCVAPQVLQFKPVVWEKGEVQELPTFSGDPDGNAQAINDKGQAAGFSGNCTTAFHALLWQNGTATDLGNLGGTMNNVPFDINNQGQVVGISDLPGDTTGHAFLWTKDDGIQDLGTLPGDVLSAGEGINSKGEVVGFSIDASGNSRGFLRQNGVMTDLNTLIPAGSPLFLLEAFTINDHGQIAGLALQISTGEVLAFLATPVPGSESATPVTPGATSERPKVVLPENVRKMLRQRMARRYHIRGFGASPRD